MGSRWHHWTAVALLVAAACSDGASTQPPSELDRIVTAVRIAAPDNVRAWEVVYRSETITGMATTVTGWIAIPEARAEMPVMAWAHPTAGLGDDCAPSRVGGRTPFHFEHELEAGWVVVATDYEGLGGPGLHPYLVSESEARSIFDIVRAARELDGRVGSDLLLWGFSQGGHAVLSAAALAPALAPDLDVLGTVAVAPAVDLIGWPAWAIGTSQQGYLVAVVAGFAAAYDLDVTEVLAPPAVALLGEVETFCGDPTFYAVAKLPADEAFATSPAEIEPWATLLTENSPAFFPIGSPVLLVLGDQDELWPIDLLSIVVERMCAVDTPVATSIHLGQDHSSVTGAARGETHTFLADRVARLPFESEC